MPAPLPILPASMRFYGTVKIVEILQGEYRDGRWVTGAETTREIQGSFQSPDYLRMQIDFSGDVGMGTRILFSREFLAYYDIHTQQQIFVEAEGLLWRIIDRQNWGPISLGLYVYRCERYHETTSGNNG